MCDRNFTKTPNELFDGLLALRGDGALSPAELRVTLAVLHQIRYHDRSTPLSVEDVEQLSGLSRKGAWTGLTDALKRGTLAREVTPQGIVYSLGPVLLQADQPANDLPYSNGICTDPPSEPQEEPFSGGNWQAPPINEQEWYSGNRLNNESKKYKNENYNVVPRPEPPSAPTPNGKTPRPKDPDFKGHPLYAALAGIVKAGVDGSRFWAAFHLLRDSGADPADVAGFPAWFAENVLKDAPFPKQVLDYWPRYAAHLVEKRAAAAKAKDDEYKVYRLMEAWHRESERIAADPEFQARIRRLNEEKARREEERRQKEVEDRRQRLLRLEVPPETWPEGVLDPDRAEPFDTVCKAAYRAWIQRQVDAERQGAGPAPAGMAS